MNRRIVISRSRNPFELFLLAACVLSGAGGILNSGKGSSVIAQSFSGTWQLVWYVGLMLGGLISLIGALGPRMIYLYVERIGLFLLSSTLLIFSSILILQVTNRLLALPILTLLFFSAACISRLIQIHRELKGVTDG